jgi:hypothetical protein
MSWPTTQYETRRDKPSISVISHGANLLAGRQAFKVSVILAPATSWRAWHLLISTPTCLSWSCGLHQRSNKKCTGKRIPEKLFVSHIKQGEW